MGIATERSRARQSRPIIGPCQGPEYINPAAVNFFNSSFLSSSYLPCMFNPHPQSISTSMIANFSSQVGVDRDQEDGNLSERPALHSAEVRWYESPPGASPA